MIYALERLGENVPAKLPNTFYSSMLRDTKQQISIQALRMLIGKDPAHRLTAEHIARLEKIWGQRAENMAELVKTAEDLRAIAKTLREADPATVRSRLRDANAALLPLVIQVIAQRRLSLESDLIDLLSDPQTRSSAHDGLVRLARGTDFGPTPGASQKSVACSVEKWRQWLALQQSVSPESLAKGAAAEAAGKRVQNRPPEIVPLVLAGNEQLELTAGIAKMSEELVNAKGDEQLALLARLRESKGNDNTDAIALAIPKLTGDTQRQARDALTQRLAQMSAATLRERLQDDNIEVRRAAALACGRKNAKEHIPDLLQLLDDAEMNVVQSARKALTELTGKDFGPTTDADSRKRADAAEAWRKWWKDRPSK